MNTKKRIEDGKTGTSMGRIAVSVCFLMLASVILTLPLRSAQSTEIRIVGVTDGSTYTEFVKPRWYSKNAKATLKKNAEKPVPFENGSKIADNGRYQLTVRNTENEKTINFTIDSRADHAVIVTNHAQTGTHLKVYFKGGDYYRGTKRNGTPMMAIWVEDLSGNYLQSLYVSAAPATNILRYSDDWWARPQGLPNWMHKAGIERKYKEDWIYLADPGVGIPPDIDAVSGATQKQGFLLETRRRGGEHQHSRIRVCFEINQSFDNGWYIFGDNDRHEEDGDGSFDRDDYFRGTGVGEPAIVYAVEIDLRSHGTYRFGGHDGQKTINPVGYSHYAGRTGKLYTDFYALDGNKQRYKFDHAPRMVEELAVEVIPNE